MQRTYTFCTRQNANAEVNVTIFSKFACDTVCTDCPTLRLTQVGTLNHSTTTPFLIKGVALILHHTFNQSLVIIIIINEDS